MNAISDVSPDAAVHLPYPYLLFLGDTTEPGFAKTAFGVRDWAAAVLPVGTQLVVPGEPGATPASARATEHAPGSISEGAER